MPTLANNAQAIKGAKLINGKRTEYAISGVPGLKLHVYPSGKRAYYFHYFLRDGAKYKHKAEPIGDGSSMRLSDAAEEARALQTRVDKGGDPTAERHAENKRREVQIEREAKGLDFKTFDDMAQAWLNKQIRPKLRSADQWVSRYNRHIKPALGDKLIGDIERGDVIELIDRVLEKGGYEANRVQHLVSAVFRWGVEEGHIKFDPTYRLRYRHKEQPRTKALTQAELKAIWIGLDDPSISPQLRSIHRLLMLTGQRKMEVAGMRKAELDLDGELPVWTIPSERSKNGVAHRVPLPPMALDIIREAVRASGDSPYVFPSPQTGRPYSSVSVGHAGRKLREKLELGDDIRVHDYRRTAGTQMASLKISAEDRARVFNHVRGAKNNTTTKVYDVYSYDDEKLAALKTWENRLKVLIGVNVGSNVRQMLAMAKT
jgi:integrase